MRLITFLKDEALLPGIMYHNAIYKLSSLLSQEIRDFPGFLAEFPDAIEIARKALEGDLASGALAGQPCFEPNEVRIKPPIPRPGKIVCIGQNYRSHLNEQSLKPHTFPVVFAKWPSCTLAQGEPILLPRSSKKVDIEAELAVVIGKKAKDVPKEKALEYVLGYSILNDVSARDVQFSESQWVRGKSFDTFAPFGPWIVTADEIPDPSGLRIRSWINDFAMQDALTSDMVFGVPEVISYLSSCFTLEPGDVIATGTPGGVGHFRNPPVYLKTGDTVRIEIERIGILENPVNT
jgi:acylpyruvate hydrolase